MWASRASRHAARWRGARGFAGAAAEAAAKSSAKPNPQSGGPIGWKALAVFCGVGTGGLAYYSIEKERRIAEIMRPKTIGKAAIGGPFELLDKNGNIFTDSKLLGRWSLIYFGFTMCPDICPDELTKVSEALTTLTKHGRKVASGSDADLTPVFISIDPERDSCERTSEYAEAFHPAFVGLTGSLEQVQVAAKAYRVYFSKDETVGDDYLVDHSIITYLQDPAGEFSEFYGKNITAPEMAARIEAKMLAWKGP